MKKVALVLSMVALACGGAGFALGAATFVRADDEAPVRTDLRETTTTRAPVRVEAVTEAETVAVAATEAVAEADADFRVRRLVVTSAISSHEPVDTIGTMEVDEHSRVYAFLDLANRGGAGSVTVTFQRDGGEATGLVELAVPAGARRWRTWAFSRGVDRPGDWRALVRDHDGRLLAEQSFVVE